MHKRITFKNTEHSDVMENYANEQLEKIVNFLEHERTPIYIDLLIEPSKTHAHHHVELRVNSAQYNLISDFEGPDIYAVLDHVIDVMYQQLHEEKRREVDERKTRGRHEEFKKQR
jgi:ribosomal subunit interface protein